MGKNLIWLSEKFFPDKKIIVWAASIHNSKNAWYISSKYDGYTFMGDVVYQSIGNKIYSLGFIAFEGEYFSFSTRNVKNISPAPYNSFEFLLNSAEFENAIVDFTFNYNDKAWLKDSRVARPFGYGAFKGNWTLVFDGFVFNKTMVASDWEKSD